MRSYNSAEDENISALPPCRACLYGIRLLFEPIREPLADPAQPIHEQPRLARAREVVVRPRVPHELRGHALLLERHEPEIGVTDRRAEVLLALHEQRWRRHAFHMTDRRQRVV